MAKEKEPEEEIVLSEATKALLELTSWDEQKQRGCLLCTFILDDFAKNGRLTAHPKNWGGDGQFPVSSKLKHIVIEKKIAENRKSTVEAPGIGEDLQ